MVWRGELPEDSLAGFWHHGIRHPDGSVIHYSGMDGVKTLRNAQIMRTDMARFCVESGHTIHEVQYPRPLRRFTPEQIGRRAESRLGQRDYHLLFHNCETFARWCVTGEGESFQSQGFFVGAAGAAASILFGGGLVGAVLTGIVATKVWEGARNRSPDRRRFGRMTDDDSDEGEFR